MIKSPPRWLLTFDEGKGSGNGRGSGGGGGATASLQRRGLLPHSALCVTYNSRKREIKKERKKERKKEPTDADGRRHFVQREGSEGGREGGRRAGDPATANGLERERGTISRHITTRHRFRARSDHKEYVLRTGQSCGRGRPIGRRALF